MKIKITTMKLIVLLKDYEQSKKGDELVVENNQAHSLIEAKVAVLKEMYKPPKDKMLRKKSKKIRTKQIYGTP